MLGTFVFSETTPSSPGTVASVGPVSSAAGYLPGGVAGPLDDYDAIDVVAELVGATGGTLDVYMQASLDEGVTWYDTIHFPQLAAGAAAKISRAAVTHHSRSTSDATFTVGKNLSPALAADTVVQGGWGNRVRLVFVAGTGTTLGAAVKVTVTGQRSNSTQTGK